MRLLLQGLALAIPLVVNMHATVEAKAPTAIHVGRGPIGRGFFFGRIVNGRPVVQTRSGRPLASGGPPSCQHNSDGSSACVTGAVDSEQCTDSTYPGTPTWSDPGLPSGASFTYRPNP
ncbi:MAG: hypothetical protein GIX02_13255 [Candidatus Eremiobacteraeota bacterium]|nr:hypothetical protein [Candidatus Eremiobacteraeota bacterium]